ITVSRVTPRPSHRTAPPRYSATAGPIAPLISSTSARGAAATSLAGRGRATIAAKSARTTHRLRHASTRRAEAPVGAERMGRLLVARRPGFEIGDDFPSPAAGSAAMETGHDIRRRAFNLHTRGQIGKELPADAPTAGSAQAMAAALTVVMPNGAKLSRVAATEPSTSMPRQASSITTT